MNKIEELQEEIKLLERKKQLLEDIVELKKLADEHYKEYVPYPIYPIYPSPTYPNIPWYRPYEVWCDTGTSNTPTIEITGGVGG